MLTPGSNMPLCSHTSYCIINTMRKSLWPLFKTIKTFGKTRIVGPWNQMLLEPMFLR